MEMYPEPELPPSVQVGLQTRAHGDSLQHAAKIDTGPAYLDVLPTPPREPQLPLTPQQQPARTYHNTYTPAHPARTSQQRRYLSPRPDSLTPPKPLKERRLHANIYTPERITSTYSQPGYPTPSLTPPGRRHPSQSQGQRQPRHEQQQSPQPRHHPSTNDLYTTSGNSTTSPPSSPPAGSDSDFRPVSYSHMTIDEKLAVIDAFLAEDDDRPTRANAGAAVAAADDDDDERNNNNNNHHHPPLGDAVMSDAIAEVVDRMLLELDADARRREG